MVSDRACCCNWQSGNIDETAGGGGDRKSFLVQPHAAQVIGIFRLLGMDDPEVEAKLPKVQKQGGWSISGAISSAVGGSAQTPAASMVAAQMAAALKRQLVEIKTGEGKSVTLAVTAAALAMTGCDVKCACYSEYLSSRDYADFDPLFSAFGLAGSISYGTFGGLCEDHINGHGSVSVFSFSVFHFASFLLLKCHDPPGAQFGRGAYQGGGGG